MWFVSISVVLIYYSYLLTDVKLTYYSLSKMGYYLLMTFQMYFSTKKIYTYFELNITLLGNFGCQGISNSLEIVISNIYSMMTSSNGKKSASRALSAGNSPVTGEFPTQSQWRVALMFSLICAWTNGCANNRDAGYLIHHCAHYWRHCNGKSALARWIMTIHRAGDKPLPEPKSIQFMNSCMRHKGSMS